MGREIYMFKTIKKSHIIYLVAFSSILAIFWLSGCATIMHGSSQEIGIQSRPSGAKVIIDNIEFGKTPVVAKLSRKDNHIVHITLEGYQDFDATITRSTSGWVWGNIVFGGLIGLAVDAISGGLYKLTPEQVESVMAKQGMGSNENTSDIIITYVLEPNSDWEKVGNLTPAIQ